MKQKLIKFFTDTFVGLFITTVILLALIGNCLKYTVLLSTEIDDEFYGHIGQEVLFYGDTLKITNGSLITNDFYLEGGHTVDAYYVEKNLITK